MIDKINQSKKVEEDIPQIQEAKVSDDIRKKLLQKIKEWRIKLLDLTRRNNLISFKNYKTSSLLFQSPDSLFNLAELLNKKNIYTYKYSDEKEEDPQAALSLFDNQGNNKDEADTNEVEKKSIEEIFKENDRNIWISNHTDKETDKRLYNLYLRSKESIREQGINTLFAAFGFIHYYEIDYSEEEIRAPLILIPIYLERTSRSFKHKHNFTFKLLEEDVQINPAIIQKLKIDFNLDVPELGEETIESVEDVENWLNKFQKIIDGEQSWKISKEFCLGIFTFRKLQMYHDIKQNANEVLLNKILQLLVGAPLELAGDFSDVPEPDELDKVLFPSDLHQVLDADSSQQVAIEAAKKGKSFVIQGPPGTGKSQTIVNIISELLAANKRILFVSEKLAALDVVKKRLDAVDLGSYCLELHSHKANKKEVLKQLEEQLNLKRKSNISLSGDQVYSNLKTVRSELNNYGTELLEPRGEINKSLYEIIGEFISLYDYPDIPIEVENALHVSKENYNSTLMELKKLEVFEYEFSHFKNHPWKGTNIKNFNLSVSQKLKELIKSINSYKDKLLSLNKIAFRLTGKNPGTIKETLEFIEVLIKVNQRPNKVKLSQNWFDHKISEDFELVKAIFNLEKENLDFIKDLKNHYKDSFFNVNFSDHINKIENEFSNLFRLLKKDYWEERKVLLGYVKNKRKFFKIYQDLKILEKIEKNNIKSAENKSKLKIIKISHYDNSLEEWKKLKEALEWVNELVKLDRNIETVFVNSINNNPKELEKLNKEYKVNFEEGFYKELQDLLKNYFSQEKLPWDEDIQVMKLEKILAWLEELQLHFEKLRKLIEFNNLILSFDGALRSFVYNYLDNDQKSDKIVETYKKAFLKEIINSIYSKISVNSGDYYNKVISEFRKWDENIMSVARSRIVNDLESAKPQADTLRFTRSSEMAILRREIEKERRHKPLRRLLAEIPNLVSTLKPCFMMSPLSVAHFIDLKKMDKFDYVIFDEASQIMPEDSICSLIRAKNAIIVGDSQQLPPNRFFATQDDELEIDEELEDLDSILKSTVPFLKEKYLEWHYRSKDESLIAFSNKNFYKNRLITFPNSEYSSTKTGVEFVFVEKGLYDRGGSRKNIPEAQKVVELIKKHIDTNSEKSLGVVAFSIQQQRAIQERIEFLIRQQPKYSNFIENKEDIQNEFFVKNLENVQGDERDVMIFSIGYGPDENGRMTLNFGPITKEGGYKRLNVAITRAREKNIVVSSFQPETINRESLTNQGTRYLINFMRYAKNGIDELGREMGVSDLIQLDSVFEEAVYERLTKRGWSLSSQVGVSGFRIDLAVKNPKKHGVYLLGIECDGRAYHSSKTARDRDRIRQGVLENLGWVIHRIWSTDWLLDPDREIAKIENKLRKLLNIKDHDKANFGFQKDKSINKLQIINNIFDNRTTPEYDTYEKIELPKRRGGIMAFNNSYYSTYENQIEQIVSKESPIYIDLLLQRIIESWGLSRAGANIHRTIESTLNYMNGKSITYKDKVVWRGKPKDIVPIRISNENQRPFHLIPIPELGGLTVEILNNAYSIDREDLMLEMSKAFGFARRGERLQKHLVKAIEYLKEKKIIKIIGNRVQLNKQVKLNE